MSLIRNSAWNIAGLAVPILIAIPAMGFLARLLGVEKFGLFTLAYAVVGYASIFDAGLSRAVVRAVAMYSEDENQLRKILGTSTCFIFALSLLATIILFLSAEKLTSILSISRQTHDDAVRGFQYLSLAVTPLLLSTVWFSYLEGKSSFRKLSVLKSYSGASVVLLPLVLMAYEVSFTTAVFGLIAGRVITAATAYCYALEHHRMHIFTRDMQTLKALLRFGGWITVSNVLSPIMVYFDRFFISSILGAQSVAFYTAPAEAISRLLLIPGAIARVIFPKLSAKHLDAEQQVRLAYKLLFIFSLLTAGIVFALADWILLLWMGPEYLGDAVIILRILTLGFIFNSLAQIPFARIQAAGHSKTTALIHTVEVIPYILVLYVLILNFSLVGAAMAWTIRVFIDYLVLEIFSRSKK